MSTEVYSKRMAVHVRRELRQADGASFRQLLTYFQRRGGPGLRLAIAELEARLQRQRLNYPLQSA